MLAACVFDERTTSFWSSNKTKREKMFRDSRIDDDLTIDDVATSSGLDAVALRAHRNNIKKSNRETKKKK